MAGPSDQVAQVPHQSDWLAGSQMNSETTKSGGTQSNSPVSYKTDELQLYTNVNDRMEASGSFYQKVNKKLETNVNLAWTAGASNTDFAIAAKYQMDPDAYFSTTVNSSSLTGLEHIQTVKLAVRLTVSE
ncbi:voltage-dependent anion-selective channel protein 1-like [Lynx rufus]|uniref:voltage-dependent anion-selective channel protein 1-like n=1 Tax=Lynx rufus TaxID=61384 RepID=UPI001F127EF3|nr:voltage-dependent anion-selective channel protein 1-like [Lynx rufus]